MNTRFLQRLFRLVPTLLVGAMLPVHATLHYVAVDDNGFAPAVLNINAGDTVVWINVDELASHTTTSDADFPDPDAWHAILIDYEDTFSKTFDNAGTFTYKDLLDSGAGTIVVATVNTPPIILESTRIIGGQFVFDATGLTAGRETVLESSTNLVEWTALTTNLADSSALTFSNTMERAQHFFRVRQLP